MFGWDTLVLLKHLLDEGLNKTDIAKRLGVSRRVIHHWIKTDQLARLVEPVAIEAATESGGESSDHATPEGATATYP